MDINIKDVSPELFAKYRQFREQVKKNRLTTKLVVNSLFERMLDDQIKAGFPEIKKVKKLF